MGVQWDKMKKRQNINFKRHIRVQEIHGNTLGCIGVERDMKVHRDAWSTGNNLMVQGE